MMKSGPWCSSPGRGHDQQEKGERDWHLARRNRTRKDWPWGWIQVRRRKGRYYRMGRSSRRAQSDGTDTHGQAGVEITVYAVLY